MSAKRVQWVAAFLTALSGVVILYAQNPVSISQVGTTPVTTTVPVSGTVTANMGTVTADPFGANADAASATGSISAKLRFIAGTGIPITGTVTVGSHAVTNAGTFATQSAITAASGSIASGAIASGAVASGAIASGAIASGAVASGAFASDSGSFGVGATAAAPPAKAVYVAGITSGATGGLLSTGVTVCDSSGYLDMTTATTTEIAPLVASRTIRVCQIVAMANGTTVMTLKRGTGTNCGTGTASVSPAFDLTTQTGFSAGTGFGEILGAAGAGTAGGAMTSGNALCVTSSAAVNLHVMIRYAVY